MHKRTAALLAGLVVALAACADESRTPVTPEPSSGPLLAFSGTYGGSLSGAGDYDNHPNGTYYQSLVSGTHSAFLSGPGGGPDFDLYLFKWNGSAWVIVASSTGSSATEQISYSGTSGFYIWQVYSYSGSGTYSVTISAP